MKKILALTFVVGGCSSSGYGVNPINRERSQQKHLRKLDIYEDVKDLSEIEGVWQRQHFRNFAPLPPLKEIETNLKNIVDVISNKSNGEIYKFLKEETNNLGILFFLSFLEEYAFNSNLIMTIEENYKMFERIFEDKDFEGALKEINEFKENKDDKKAVEKLKKLIEEAEDTLKQVALSSSDEAAPENNIYSNICKETINPLKEDGKIKINFNNLFTLISAKLRDKFKCSADESLAKYFHDNFINMHSIDKIEILSDRIDFFTLDEKSKLIFTENTSQNIIVSKEKKEDNLIFTKYLQFDLSKNILTVKSFMYIKDEKSNSEIIIMDDHILFEKVVT